MPCIHTFRANLLIPLNFGNRHVSVSFYCASHVVPLQHAPSHIFQRLVCARGMSVADIVDQIRFYVVPFPMY